VLEPAAQLDHWVRGLSSRCPSTSMSTRSS
jgi:hypothetical protein